MNASTLGLSSYLRVLFVVQWLGVRVMFTDKRINKQQEEHVEQQCTHNRQVNDNGHLAHTEWTAFRDTNIVGCKIISVQDDKIHSF